VSCHEGNITNILVLEYVYTLVVVPAIWCVSCEEL